MSVWTETVTKVTTRYGSGWLVEPHLSLTCLLSVFDHRSPGHWYRPADELPSASGSSPSGSPSSVGSYLVLASPEVRSVWGRGTGLAVAVTSRLVCGCAPPSGRDCRDLVNFYQIHLERIYVAPYS